MKWPQRWSTRTVSEALFIPLRLAFWHGHRPKTTGNRTVTCVSCHCSTTKGRRLHYSLFSEPWMWTPKCCFEFSRSLFQNWRFKEHEFITTVSVSRVWASWYYNKWESELLARQTLSNNRQSDSGNKTRGSVKLTPKTRTWASYMPYPLICMYLY
jgi:hypothetical protein